MSDCTFCDGRGCLACPPDLRSAVAAGVAGQALVAQAEPDYAESVRAWVAALPVGQRFISDDVRQALGDPERPNVMGAAIGGCVRQRLIRRVGWSRSARVVGHGNPVVEWERA